jgi:hypothetical protein
MWYLGATPPRPCPGHTASSIAGISKRVAISTPAPERNTIREFSRFVALWLRHRSGLTPLSDDEIPSVMDWLATTPYTMARKTELLRIWEDCGGKPTKKQLQTVKCFIKDECYDTYKFCRGIYSRSDYAKCAFGPLVAAVSKQVFDLKWFIKKIPVIERPEAIYNRLHKIGPYEYIFTDYTAFESHFTNILMTVCEKQLFTFMTSRCGIDARQKAELMHLIKSGVQKLVFKSFNCQQQAGRMSGEMDTSLSNGFANLMMFLFAAWKAGASLEDIKGFVEGDDGIFRINGEFDKAVFEQTFKDLGMTIKIGYTKDLTQASFCGQIYDVEDGVVVTDIREAVCRFGYTNKKYVHSTEKIRFELLKAKGYSFAHQYGRCPVLGTLGETILRLTDKINIRQSIIDQMDEWERARFYEAMRLGSTVSEPPIKTRQLVEKMYDIPISEQIEIEAKLRAMTEFGPLPFEFSSVPKEWVDYCERYSNHHPANEPVWIPSRQSGLVRDLINFGAINASQALRMGVWSVGQR